MLAGHVRRVKPEGARKHKSRQSLRPFRAERHRRVTGLCDAVPIAFANAVSVSRVSVASLACQSQTGKKVAYSSVMTTDSSSVTVPPRKGETGQKNRHSYLRSKSWEGESPAARSFAAALGDNKKPAELGLVH
jgi:hypothetical protein